MGYSGSAVVGLFTQGLLLCTLFLTVQSVRVRRGYAQLDAWTDVTSFCYLPSAGYLTYRVTSRSYDVYLHVYTTSLPHSATNITHNVTYSADAAALEDLNDGNYSTWRPVSATPPIGNISTRVTPVTGNNFGVKNTTVSRTDRCNELPERSKVVTSFLVWAHTSAGDIRFTWPTHDVMCINVAISTRCRKAKDVLIDIALTNGDSHGNKIPDKDLMDAPIISLSSLSFLWRHLSADTLSFPITDSACLLFVCMLLVCAICIRRNIMQRALYAHAVSACCLSLALLLVYLLSRNLLHVIYLLDGQPLSNRVHVVIDLTLHASQALFFLALVLHALRHTWCNPPHRFRTGYIVTVVGCAVAITYGLCLVAIQAFEAFSNYSLIALYTVLALKSLLWFVFVVLVISTVLHPKNNSYKGSTLRLNTQGPSSKPLRSLFGDYDYPTPLASLASPEHLEEDEVINNDDENAPDEDGPEAYFDHRKTKPKQEDTQSWIGIEVTGHKDYEAQPLGGCDIVIYSIWFLTVPIVALWIRFLLPQWMNKQCIYAMHLLFNVVAYVYFLTCAAIFRQRSDDVTNAKITSTTTTGTTTKSQPKTRTIEQLTVI